MEGGGPPQGKECTGKGETWFPAPWGRERGYMIKKGGLSASQRRGVGLRRGESVRLSNHDCTWLCRDLIRRTLKRPIEPRRGTLKGVACVKKGSLTFVQKGERPAGSRCALENTRPPGNVAESDLMKFPRGLRRTAIKRGNIPERPLLGFTVKRGRGGRQRKKGT